MTKHAGLPGGGPWLILKWCPNQEAHNTLRAARGISRRPGAKGIKCVCPRGRVLSQLENASRRVVWDERKALLKEQTGHPFPVAHNVKRVTQASTPPYFTGKEPCQTPAGALAHEAVIGAPTSRKIVELAKKFCNEGAGCPLKEKCAQWALEGEVYPGSWGAVYGGLSKTDRITIRGAKL